jgi:hypothetical protein
MPPENFSFGGGANETVLHPLVLVAMLLAIALILLLPRKYVIVPLLAITFMVPFGQELLISGLHFFVYRIVVLAASLRILFSMLSSPEGAFGGRLDGLDKLFVLWAISRACAAILLFMQLGAVIYQMGFLLDAIGGYFVLRHLIRDDEDIYRTIRVFAALAIVISGCMLYEKLLGVNVFGFLGGIASDPQVRGGSIRAQGPFQHSILAGAFGATLLPLFYLLWKSGESRALAAAGAVASTVMMATTASSTPVLAYASGLAAILCWPLRKQMRLIRWGIVAMLISLHLVMKAPVWFLIQRIDIIGGSSGSHRAELVNDFITHFRDWWLLGTKENSSWGYHMWDLANQFVFEGQTGGLMAFACFIAIICVCFSRIGKARRNLEGDRGREWYFWLLGSALFSHVVAFFGISYFDQTRAAWFALLAIVSAATAPYLAAKQVPEQAARSRYLPLKPAYSTPFPSRTKPIFSLKQQAQVKS